VPPPRATTRRDRWEVLLAGEGADSGREVGFRVEAGVIG
jgi:hypothetical protein